MTLLDHSSVSVDGQRAMLVKLEQYAYGTLFRKWMLAVDRPGETVLIVASFPKAEAKQGEDLKAAILTASFGGRSNSADALAFVATPVEPFQVARVMGQTMLLSPGGRFPLKDENAPRMVLGLSASEDLTVADQEAFAEHRVTRTATVKNITVDETTSITIGPLSGYATIARGERDDTTTPLTIYQILLFDTSDYAIMQGITPEAMEHEYIPIFQQIARTFRMKKSQTKAIDSENK
jgi:hypothetical protein